uniref:Peptidase A2 domain-containing protein n=1 Tax=Timema monikensis TaxID=170555 RepID=A0A7R9E3E3_9NEOP|nr:unnamed protein product [Timema monikensis]
MAYQLFSMGSETRHNPPFHINVMLNGTKHHMEIDSGAALTVVSSVTYEKIWTSKPKLMSSDIKLCTWGTKQPLCILGRCNVEATYNGRSATLPVTVVEGNGPSLLRINWFTELGIKVQGIHHITDSKFIETIQKFSVFEDLKLGEYVGPPISLKMDSSVQPQYLRSHPIPPAPADDSGGSLSSTQSTGDCSSSCGSEMLLLEDDGSAEGQGDSGGEAGQQSEEADEAHMRFIAQKVMEEKIREKLRAEEGPEQREYTLILWPYLQPGICDKNAVGKLLVYVQKLCGHTYTT